MDRAKFYDKLRRAMFPSLSKSQVEGMEAVLNAWNEDDDIRYLAYILGTIYHECATTMQPIREFGGKAYFIRRYWDNQNVAKQLGNLSANDAQIYHGRGFVQLTGRYNYAKASKALGIDLLGDPDKAMELDVATKILYKGMHEGWFTGKKLSDYIGESTNFVGARKIINGIDKASLIASYANGFLTALS